VHMIQKDIPLPPPPTKYPFGSMAVGDSFATDVDRNVVSSAARDYGKRNGKQFSIRMHEGTLRVWRVA